MVSMSMTVGTENSELNPIAKVVAGVSLAGVISFGAWTNTALPYNDQIPKGNINPVVPMKVEMKNKYCLENKDANRK